MGTWNIAKPYGNDSAADWLGDLMNQSSLRTKWLTGIAKDPANEPEVVRAAIWLFEQLGHVYVWPIEDYEQDLELAIEVVEEMQRRALRDCSQLIIPLRETRRSLVARRKLAELEPKEPADQTG